MKKIYLLCFLFIMLLWTGMAMAESQDMGALTLEELNAWVGEMTAMAEGKALLNDPKSPEANTDDGYAYDYGFATLYYNTNELGSESELLAIRVTDPETPAPRDITVDSFYFALLGAYANENIDLLGDREFAGLYLFNNLPEEVFFACLQRDGQRIYGVQYTIHEQLAFRGEGYTDCGLYYLVDGPFVSEIFAYGLNNNISEEEVIENLAELEQIFDQKSYKGYSISYLGTDLEAFGTQEDMGFLGIDMNAFTPEDGNDLFGEFEHEEWLQDDTGEWIRSIQWKDISISFLYQNNKKDMIMIDTIQITGDGVEGPRGVRIDDDIASVMIRFKHSEGSYEGTQEMLYGDGANPPYGIANYGDDMSAYIIYGALMPQSNQSITMSLTFIQDSLVSIMIYTW